MTRRQRRDRNFRINIYVKLTRMLAAWPILAAIAITATNALASRPIEPAPVCWLKPWIGCDPTLNPNGAGE